VAMDGGLTADIGQGWHEHFLISSDAIQGSGLFAFRFEQDVQHSLNRCVSEFWIHAELLLHFLHGCWAEVTLRASGIILGFCEL